MKSYYRIMLGPRSKYADEALRGNFIGADFGLHIDLTKHLSENWRDFNEKFIPIFLKEHIDRTKVAAGLACGMLWTVSKGILIGDIVLCPNGNGSFLVGEVISNYEYNTDQVLPHRRNVKWFPKLIDRSQMSNELQNSAGSIGTVSNVSKYAIEIDKIIAGETPISISSNDETIEDAATFALEKHLEDFLVQNWKNTDLGKHYNIFEEDGELVGQQYPSDTGPIDILAISKDKKELLVVELKRGRISDVAIGQVQRYMGYVKEELAEKGQDVKGVIIALENDIRMRRALAVTNKIEFYTYKVSFKLNKE